ncbi:P-loop containing nucleoside triphosphate hydrolase protein [Roridomyces roridus]|uniref:P-loop containing nucleoside triphosphate hydrolase protein n=1 Tax=Roridomyces roridus TaxID=1738132 RepID=A0AAD7FUI9_9AGAR|nr:P-loop containing nucleoside triphosphate hydrolase protein [Roridomyces roridus]
MGKRRVDSDDEDPSAETTPASKRARTADSDEDEAPRATSSRRASKGKAKSRRRDEESDDDEDQDDDEEVEEKDEDERELEADILASLESKRGTRGGVADHGIIETIEMHQFMCHKFLTFTFGPQINFIIGHNGSGKSAVLSAITVALGGKANSTGRGNGLKSFIREGQSASEVTISLKNQGEEAYKPQEYGKSIVITRRFTKEGSSTWKIKSKTGKLISSKKDELAAICDHMNIQVDNPMNVLTQDAARQFLSASVPSDKYKFFLRGTQLSQLSEEYDICFSNITTTSKVLEQKQEALPDLKRALRDATSRWQEASKAREQKQKVAVLKKEQAWAHVTVKRKEMEGKIEDVAKATRRVPRVQQSLDTAQANLEAADKVVVEEEQKLDELGDREGLNDKRKEVQDEIKKKRDTVISLHSQMKDMDGNIKKAKRQMEDYQQQIDKETKRLEQNTEAKRAETQQKMQAARDAAENAQKAVESLSAERAAAEEEAKRIEAEGRPLEQALRAANEQVQQCRNNIDNCRRAEKDRYAAYGTNIQQVVQQINQTRWKGEKPLGPLGIHCKVRDNQWARLLRFTLGSMLSSFAVTTVEDLRTLKKILESSGNPNVTVLLFKPDLFEYKHGEPPEHVLTVLRALEISDDHVLRILINKSSIESRVLAPTRLEAQHTLSQLRGGAQAWTNDGFLVTKFSEGGESSVPLHIREMNAGLLVGNASDELARWTQNHNDAQAQHAAAKAAHDAGYAKYGVARDAFASFGPRLATAEETVRRAKTRMRQLLEEINEDTPAELSALNEAYEESNKDREMLTAQFTDISRQKATLDAEMKELITQRDAYTAQITDFLTHQQQVKDTIEKAAENRTKFLSDVQGWKKKLEVENAKVKEAQEVADHVQTEFEEWTAKAELYCARVETDRDPDELERIIKSTQDALKERERRHGASVDEMTDEVNKARERLERTQGDLNKMGALVKALKKSLSVRLSKWQEFRRHIALRCKLVFGYHLSQRGYYGKVMFDHDKGTLQLKVQTDDQAATQGVSRDKDPRSLSGGEKSFSTICLLLSLWESIGCPLRCLDEFDVFMDAVNRRISMKMMIDVANQSDKKQYVLITPQDMTNVTLGPTVRVHRMTDPERGQGVLGFSG